MSGKKPLFSVLAETPGFEPGVQALLVRRFSKPGRKSDQTTNLRSRICFYAINWSRRARNAATSKHARKSSQWISQVSPPDNRCFGAREARSRQTRKVRK